MDERDNLPETFRTPGEGEYTVTDITEDAPVAETPVDETPVSETPVSETTVSENPVGETPASETPVGENPASENPASENPVSENPVSENPVSENPASETPMSETPVQHTEKVVYDAFMYEPIGFDRQDKAAAARYAEENAAREKRIRARRERSIVVTFFIIAAASVALSLYGIISDIFRSGGNLKSPGGKQVVLYQNSKPEGANDLSSFVDENGRYTTEGAAAAVSPSIVEIYTYNNASKTTLVGTGSGVVISDDGYIVTNAHVLLADGFHTINSVDGKTYSARIIGRDAKTDIAVIKVNTSELQPAVLGNSDEVIVGENVIAIGNPAGLSSTVTDGIVSAVNRKIRSDSTGFQMDCIQTNAAISPGNSGGALVNMYGQVIGITSSKYVSSSYEGLGFAITINEARPIIEELIENGFVPGRFRVGITFIETSDESHRKTVEEELGFELPKDFGGLYITDISEECDISNTELKKGDFIYSIDGVNTTNYDEFNDTVTASYGPGDKVKARCAHLHEDGTIDYYDIEFKLMEDTSGNF